MKPLGPLLLAVFLLLHVGCFGPRGGQAARERIAELGGKVGISGKTTSGSIISVSLEGTSVTDDDLAILENLPGLQKVNLCYTNISDAGLRHLEGLTELRVVRLKQTRVTEDGLQRLRRALPKVNLYR